MSNFFSFKGAMFLFFLLLLSVNLSAQATVTFEANADAKTAVKNSFIEVSFTLKNANGSNFKAPDFKNFKVSSGPSRAARTTIVNGRMSQELSYSYTLQPRKTGNLTIGSASITVNNRKLNSQPISIKVVEGKDPSVAGVNSDEVPFFVRAETNAVDAKIGQQVILDYKLYTTVNIDSYNVLEESEYQGFYAQDIRRYNSRVQKEVIDGIQYSTKILKRVALFPQQAGRITIEPLELQMGVVQGNPSGRSDFFFNRQIKRVPVSSEAIDINVVPLPANPPVSFSGAVGNFDVGVTIENQIITTDDALSIKMIISGDGDLKRVNAPDLDLPRDSFELYDPKVLDESIIEKQGQLEGQKIFEYLALPKYPAIYKIQPKFTYYHPDSAAYVTLKGNTYEIAVRQGSNKSTLSPVLEDQTKLADIRPIILETELSKPSSSFFGSSIFWLLSLLPLLVLGGAFTYRQIMIKRNNVDADELKRRKAKKQAQKRLVTAQKHLKNKDSKAFYDEVSRALFGYVCAKLNIPMSELSKENVKGKLQSLQVQESYINDFMETVKTSEMALFAGMDNSAAMQQTYDKTLEVITNIEEGIK